MKKSLLILFVSILFCLSSSFSAEQSLLSLRAQYLVNQYTRLEATPEDTRVQLSYLVLFPQHREAFTQLFAPDDFSELYRTCYQYISVLSDLSNTYPQEVGFLLISITRDGVPGCCDAWSVLHTVMVEYVLSQTETFVTMLKTLSQEEQANVITFIADVENHHVFEKYQQIIEQLESQNEYLLADAFIAARTQRMTEQQH